MIVMMMRGRREGFEVSWDEFCFSFLGCILEFGYAAGLGV